MQKELYQKLQSLPSDVDNYLITSLNASNFGATLLLSKEQELYRSPSWSDGIEFFKEIASRMEESGISQSAKISKTGILEISENQRYFVEKLANEKKVYICGAGHVSLPIIRMGKMLGFHVTCIEDRPKFAKMAEKTGADVVICEEFATALKDIAFDKDSYFVIVTRGHHYDEDCLRQILGHPYAYLGMMGSKRRVAMIKQHLLQDGFNTKEVQDIHAPIGLAIKAQTPEEIAVSIWAQIISVKNETQKGEGFGQDMLSGILHSEEEMVLATIISRKGSAPRQVGTKMLISPTTTLGTIGGGCAEADAVKAAREMLLLKNTNAQIYHINMTEEAAAKDGMVCGGVIEVLMKGLYEEERCMKDVDV